MIVQQIIGVINFSIPIIIAYRFLPDHVLRSHGIAFFALLIGCYVAFAHYKQASHIGHALKYTPTEGHLDTFNNEIKKCGIHPEDVQLRYGYNNDGIATTTLNTLAVDPMVWHGVNDDKDVIAIKDVIERQILPHATEQQKEMHLCIKNNLTPEAQNFIFRHELGHIRNKTTLKIISALFAIATTATVIGMSTASMLIGPYGGFVAMIIGMIAGGTSDEILGLVSNALVKATEENEADKFAIEHSSPEEIRAAAQFFAQYESGAQKVRNATLLYKYLPVSATTAHPDSITRVAYLEKAVQEKTI